MVKYSHMWGPEEHPRAVGLAKGAQMKDGMEGLENRKVPPEVCVFKEDSGYSMGKGKKRWEKPVQRLLLGKKRDTGRLD